MKPITALSVVLALGIAGQAPSGPALAAFPVESISYLSHGFKITGIMAKPEGSGPFPLLLVNHGGLDPASKISGFVETFAKLGYVALASDYRGCGQSEGQHEIAKGEVDDVLGALEYAKTLSYVDGKRVVVFGFSHGGAISLLAAARCHEIKAVVELGGPIELADAWRHWDANHIKGLADLYHFVGGTPDHLPQEWKARSALYVADKIACPVMILHGGKDPLVDPAQAERMAAALRAAGNSQVTLIVDEEGGHMFDAKAWGRHRREVVNFLNRAAGLPELP